MRVADVEQGRVDALRLDGLAVHERHSERISIQGEGGVDVLYRESDVVDGSEHAQQDGG